MQRCSFVQYLEYLTRMKETRKQRHYCFRIRLSISIQSHNQGHFKQLLSQMFRDFSKHVLQFQCLFSY